MKLIDLLDSVEDWNDDETTIYVRRPWSCEAESLLVRPAPDTAEPIVNDGTEFEYFLETFIARDFLDGFLRSVGRASREQQCERLIYYAENDA